MTQAYRLASVALILATAAACGDDTLPTEPAILQRPTAITFGCIGDLVIDPGGPDERRVPSAQPIESCRALAFGEDLPGQEQSHQGGNAPGLVAFVTQSSKGTVAVLKNIEGSNVILDSDRLTPGKNAIPIGTLPIASGADESGCFLVTANSGTCDLSSLDMTSADSSEVGPKISRITIQNAAGEVIDAKPAAMVMSPQTLAVGSACPETPIGTAYVAYPDCNLVAAVDLESGVIQGGLQFDADGNVTVVDGNVRCASQCGGGNAIEDVDAGPGPDAGALDAGAPDAGALDAGALDAGPDGGPDAGLPPQEPASNGAPRPTTLHLERLGGQLLVGSSNSNTIVVSTQDTDGRPTATRSMTVEGEVGITKIKVSDSIQMGGATGSPGGTGGDFQFVYAISTDRSIRVLDLDDGNECDTQADPRFLQDETSVGFLACIPVNGPDAPPRRAGANGPGIRISRDAAALDVEFATFLRSDGGFGGPTDMAGTYAFVSSSAGTIFVINIDDDVYPDLESSTDPEVTFLTQAISHQVRDFVVRNPIANPDLNRETLREFCAFPDSNDFVLPPRLRSGIAENSNDLQFSFSKRYELPGFWTQRCEVRDDLNELLDVAFLNELAFATPVLQREITFPDIQVLRSEVWSVAWQGPLSRDSTVNIDGSPVRSGLLQVNSTGSVSVVDTSAPFCEMGAQPYDLVQLAGCDPTLGDIHCGLGEECFVHPDAPSTLALGTCLPSEQTDILAVQCRDFLISNKNYSVISTQASALELRTRRRKLKTSPLDGCTSDAQCVEMAELDRQLRNSGHPIDLADGAPESNFEWVCADDPSRVPGPLSCQIACTTNDDCEGGLSCDAGFCVAGPLPPPECTLTLNRYQVNGSDAFIVIGSLSGFMHGRTVDPNTGECIDDPDANPLLQGRIPLRPAPCVGDLISDVSPNPCSTELVHQESYTPFDLVEGQCEPAAEPVALRDRTVRAVRFQNRALRFHLVDLETSGDLQCRNDRAGTYPPYSTTHNGFELNFDLTGGFIPMFVRKENGSQLDLALPKTLAPAFDGRIWVLDEGDLSQAVQGRVLNFQPGAANNNFGVSSFDNLPN